MILLDTALAALTVSLFWAGVLVARALGLKAGYSLAPLGFRWPRAGVLSGTGVGVAIGVGAVIVSFPINAASAYIVDRLGYSTESTVQGPLMRALVRWVEENPGAAVPAIFFVVVIFGPAVEELVFRGAVYNGLFRLGLYLSTSRGRPEPSPRTARRASFILAALASSVLFSLLHLEPVLLPALFILAVVLCALFERTGSLLPPFVAHAMFNSFATSLIILDGLGVVEVPI